jgi:hypothetical protein
MEPINQPARRSAKNKFFALFGLSLLGVLVVSYFLFNTPANIFKSEVKMYKGTEEEQEQLLNKIEGMVANVKNITVADQNYLSSTNEIEKGGLQSNLQEYQRIIIDGLVDIKNDSSKLASLVARKDSYNYITAFNAIVAYRNTILSLQKSLQEKGGNATELLKTKSLLDACTAQLEIYKALASNKPAPAVVPIPAGGGGGGGAANAAKEAQLQQQLEKCQTDLAACQKAKAGTVVPTPVTTTNFDESKKSAVLFEAGQDLYNKAETTKNLIERRGILSSAKMIFEKSKPGNPDVERLNKSINQIDIELKKLSNMG